MTSEILTSQIKASKEWFDRSTGCLEEADSAFAPSKDTMTAAQQVAHVAQTIDWFVEGAFGTKGFDMDFEGMGKEIAKVTSLTSAREWLDESTNKLIDLIASKTAEELQSPLPDGPIMGGQPRLAIVPGIVDHNAHHRGALTVYARLLGKTPAMPYMAMETPA
ncbi:MAG: DinB family protein [Candidatus Hydrogenedentes bacterium]|nr:DinB family protein [Candidatus Hydrogenedentota bacterium]